MWCGARRSVLHRSTAVAGAAPPTRRSPARLPQATTASVGVDEVVCCWLGLTRGLACVTNWSCRRRSCDELWMRCRPPFTGRVGLGTRCRGRPGGHRQGCAQPSASARRRWVRTSSPGSDDGGFPRRRPVDGHGVPSWRRPPPASGGGGGVAQGTDGRAGITRRRARRASPSPQRVAAPEPHRGCGLGGPTAASDERGRTRTRGRAVTASTVSNDDRRVPGSAPGPAGAVGVDGRSPSSRRRRGSAATPSPIRRRLGRGVGDGGGGAGRRGGARPAARSGSRAAATAASWRRRGVAGRGQRLSAGRRATCSCRGWGCPHGRPSRYSWVGTVGVGLRPSMH